MGINTGAVRLGSLIGIVFSLFLFILWTRSGDASYKAKTTKKAPSSVLTPTAPPITPRPFVATPQRIIIPRLNLDLPIDSVGLDETGTMALPSDVGRVGWFNHGYRPGEIGNAVIAGHLDTTYGRPAAFYSISALNPGDEIYVIDTENKTRKFMVVYKGIYEFDKVPLEVVFGSAGSEYLNLVTCSGGFDPLAKNYSHRTILYAKLIK